MPKVSIIMPSYNKEKYIVKSINSILNQTFVDWELIIIDDCSTDGSVECIKKNQDYRILFYQNEKNIGIANVRNHALEMATGEYIALLDADDISLEYRLEKEANFLDAHPEIDVVFGGFQEIDENDNIKETYFIPLKNPDYIKAKLMVIDVIPNGSCMYRKKFVDQYNIRYRNGYLGMDDYLFWVECSLYGKISGMPDLFLYWRNTAQNGTNTYKYSQEYMQERKEKYAQILRFALKGNGFQLTEEELNLYCRILSEYKYKIISPEEIGAFYHLLCKICRQAKTMKNGAEIQKVFKKQFGLSLENSYLWDCIDVGEK